MLMKLKIERRIIRVWLFSDASGFVGSPGLIAIWKLQFLLLAGPPDLRLLGRTERYLRHALDGVT